MGPEIAGRVLSVMPIWENPQAQQRVNTIGRWVALQTPRDDLPWSFAVVDSPTMNAFAAPGGYIIVTRGLYEVLQSDDEVAAVLGHEISHVVARDHYNVIMKQAATSAVTGIAIDKATAHAGAARAEVCRNYFAKQGASVLLRPCSTQGAWNTVRTVRSADLRHRFSRRLQPARDVRGAAETFRCQRYRPNEQFVQDTSDRERASGPARPEGTSPASRSTRIGRMCSLTRCAGRNCAAETLASESG